MKKYMQKEDMLDLPAACNLVSKLEGHIGGSYWS